MTALVSGRPTENFYQEKEESRNVRKKSTFKKTTTEAMYVQCNTEARWRCLGKQ